MIQQDVDVVSYFMLTSPIRFGGFGLMGKFDLRPTYYTYQLYQKFGTERVYAASGLADVSVYAARNTAGELTLMLSI